MRCFKAVPSLKINFAKSELFGARLDESNLLELAKTLTIWVARLIIFLPPIWECLYLRKSTVYGWDRFQDVSM